MYETPEFNPLITKQLRKTSSAGTRISLVFGSGPQDYGGMGKRRAIPAALGAVALLLIGVPTRAQEEPTLAGHLEVTDNVDGYHATRYRIVITSQDSNEDTRVIFDWDEDLQCGTFTVEVDIQLTRLWNHDPASTNCVDHLAGPHHKRAHVELTVFEGDTRIYCTYTGNATGTSECTDVPDHKCPGHVNDPRQHIVGTENGETLTGTPADEIICGLGGDDTITGGGGKDLLLGNAGGDTITGGSVAETAKGGNGNDTIDGGPGADHLVGNGDRDTIHGHDGNDDIDGGGGVDYLNGNGDTDNIFGGVGNDTINGGDGPDFWDNRDLYGGLKGGPGIDTIHGGKHRDTVIGGDEGDHLYGDGWGDVIWGDDGRDRLHGGGGIDWLSGGEGYDKCAGDQDEIQKDVDKWRDDCEEVYLGPMPD